MLDIHMTWKPARTLVLTDVLESLSLDGIRACDNFKLVEYLLGQPQY